MGVMKYGCLPELYEPEFTDRLKFEIIFGDGYVPNADPIERDMAGNAHVKQQKMGAILEHPFFPLEYPREIVDVIVTATNPNAGINFNLATWLDSLPDLDTQSDPSQISGNDAHLNFYGSKFNDTATGGTQEDWFEGFKGNDTFRGGDGSDYMSGGWGSDVLLGQGGNDWLHGGLDNDRIGGGVGNDLLEGGRGDDVIRDLVGDNIIYGDQKHQLPFLFQTDNDLIVTGIGNDYIEGQDGDDTIRSGAGDDQVDGGSGNDMIRGGLGNDALLGGDDDDTISGNAGDDMIFDGHGNDIMNGNAGNDCLYYSEGKDQGFGGDGDDVFKFTDASVDYDAGEWLGRNLVGDFQQTFESQDAIDLKCVEALTHLSVVALGNNEVRLIGYSVDEGDYDYVGGRGLGRLDGEKIFDIYVRGEGVGFVDGGDGYLNRDTAYDNKSGPVCVNKDVLVDLATNDDYDPDWFTI